MPCPACSHVPAQDRWLAVLWVSLAMDGNKKPRTRAPKHIRQEQKQEAKDLNMSYVQYLQLIRSGADRVGTGHESGSTVTGGQMPSSTAARVTGQSRQSSGSPPAAQESSSFSMQPSSTITLPTLRYNPISAGSSATSASGSEYRVQYMGSARNVPPWHASANDEGLDEPMRYGRWQGRREHARTVATPVSRASGQRSRFIQHAREQAEYWSNIVIENMDDEPNSR